MTVSIHQPNFLPRRSFFQKIEQSDVFVLLTYAQYSNTGYTNRFNIGDTIHTMKIENGMRPLTETRYKSPEKDWENITATYPSLRRFDNYISPNLCATNHAIIISACDKLNIRTRITRDYETSLTGTARLIDICKSHRATKYLSGISGIKYLDISLFEKSGIEVVFQSLAEMDNRPMIDFI